MKKLLATSTLILCVAGLFSQDIIDSDKKEIVFRSVNVVPMDKETVLKNQVVVVKGGKIVDVGDASKVRYSDQALVVDAEGKYLMPGLAEMHAHVPSTDNLQAQKDVLLLFATHGITTIRGMLGHPSHLELRKKINSGEITGPHFYTAGPAVNGQSVQSPEAAENLIAEEKKAGYDFLKILPGLTKENFAAVVRSAKKNQMRFAGHIPYSVGVWNSIRAGYQTIDHLDGFVEGLVPGIENMTEDQTGFFGVYVAEKADVNKIPDLIKELKQHNVWVVPTQALAERWISNETSAETHRKDPEMKYMDSKTLDNWVNAKSSLVNDPKYDSAKVAAYITLRRRIIKDCYQSGVGLLLGCDAPQVFNVPGPSTHHELKYLVDAGLTPYEALRTGTVNVAAFYKKQGKTGVIKKGAASDMILLTANPLDDISNTTKIDGVMIGNKWLDNAYIRQTLKTLEKSN